MKKTKSGGMKPTKSGDVVRYLAEAELKNLIGLFLERIEKTGGEFRTSRDPEHLYLSKDPKIQAKKYLASHGGLSFLSGILYGDEEIIPSRRTKKGQPEIDVIVSELQGRVDGYLCFDRFEGSNVPYTDLTVIQKSEFLNSGKAVGRIRTAAKNFIELNDNHPGRQLALCSDIAGHLVGPYITKSGEKLIGTCNLRDGCIATLRKKSKKINLEQRHLSLFKMKMLIAENLYQFMTISPTYQSMINLCFVDWINEDIDAHAIGEIGFAEDSERKIRNIIRKICRDNIQIAWCSPEPLEEIFFNLGKIGKKFVPRNFSRPLVEYRWLLGPILRDVMRNGIHKVGVFNWYSVVKPEVGSQHWEQVWALAVSAELANNEKKSTFDRMIWFDTAPLS